MEMVIMIFLLLVLVMLFLLFRSNEGSQDGPFSMIIMGLSILSFAVILEVGKKVEVIDSFILTSRFAPIVMIMIILAIPLVCGLIIYRVDGLISKVIKRRRLRLN